MLITMERFTQQAVNQNLSAGAILLWQRLYCTMQRKGQYTDVQQSTAVLMASLKVSRQGLQQMRQMLVEKGFLAIRMDEQQQIYYTLLIGGKEVGEAQPAADQPLSADKPLSSDARQAMQEPLAQKKEMPIGDIMLTNRYRQYIDVFCSKFGPAPKADLLQWAEMRVKNGWTLTLWGLEALLKKLIDLSAGDVMQMGKIVAQSVKRRWKGFFPISVQAQPSGKKLLKQEEKQQRSNGYIHTKPSQKFAPEGRDLSFLER